MPSQCIQWRCKGSVFPLSQRTDQRVLANVRWFHVKRSYLRTLTFLDQYTLENVAECTWLYTLRAAVLLEEIEN